MLNINFVKRKFVMDNNSSFKRVLSLREIVIFGLSFMAPATVFATYGIATVTSGGMVATGYLITMVCVLLSALSYARFAKKFSSSGSSFIYVKNTLGNNFGFMVGWAILLDYILSPMISSLLFGIFMNAYFPAIPMSILICGFLIAVSTINIVGIKLVARYSTIIVILQVAFVLLFIGFSTSMIAKNQGFDALFSIVPFYESGVSISGLFTCIPILYFSFLGFDAITTLAEETKQPQSIMPKAIFSVVLIGGVIFTISAYFMQLIVPDPSTFTNPDAAAVQIMTIVGQSFLSTTFMLLTIIGTTASAIASGSSAARIIYSMGKDEILPKRIFGYVSPHTRTPIFNIVIIGVIGLSANFIDLTFATHLISFGVIFSFIWVNFSAFVHFFIQEKQRHWFKNAILPLAGVIVSTVILLALGPNAIFLGAAWLGLGFTYLFLRSRRLVNKTFNFADL
jgi:putrescine importer